MEHVDAAVLMDFLDGELAAPRARRVAAHLDAGCTPCRRRLRRLASLALPAGPGAALRRETPWLAPGWVAERAAAWLAEAAAGGGDAEALATRALALCLDAEPEENPDGAVDRALAAAGDALAELAAARGDAAAARDWRRRAGRWRRLARAGGADSEDHS